MEVPILRGVTWDEFYIVLNPVENARSEAPLLRAVLPRGGGLKIS